MADIVPSPLPPSRSLADIPGLKQVGLLAGVAAAVAAAIWLVLWSQGQNYSVLYGQLSERESGQVMDALTAAGIEFKLNPSGAVSVPESKVQLARIRLASQGLPQSDSMGIEMIQKESALGSSSLMESARYQSVLETELARTIIKVQGVQTARVHLALPKPSVFLRDARKATASVMLQLYPGRRLDPGQVAAVLAGEPPEPWRRLPSAVLQSLLMDRIWQISDDEASIRAVLRRAAGDDEKRTGPISVGALWLDPEAHEATLAGRRLDLSRREFELLHYLALHAGQVVTKRNLLTHVWRLPYGGADKTVDVHVSWLRRKLGESAQQPRYLHTVRGVGLKLTAPP